MNNVEIHDEHSLGVWAQNRSDSQVGLIAFRAAARGFPAFAQLLDSDFALVTKLTALPLLHCLLLSALSVKFGSQSFVSQLKFASDAAGNAVSTADDNFSPNKPDFLDIAYAASDLASDAARVQLSKHRVTEIGRLSEGIYVDRNRSLGSWQDSVALLYIDLSKDVEKSESSIDCLTERLWQTEVPQWFITDETKFQKGHD